MVTCAKSQRNAGILIPQCPPKNDIEFSKTGTDGAVEYYMFAHSSHETYKATYDLLLGP